MSFVGLVTTVDGSDGRRLRVWLQKRPLGTESLMTFVAREMRCGGGSKWYEKKHKAELRRTEAF